MSAGAITRIEKLCGHSFSEEEAARLRATGDALNLRDDDAIWNILAAMEYQRVFYEVLPRKIAGASTEVLRSIADCVVEEAKRLSTKINYATLLPMGIAALVGIMAFGSLMLWAGYCFGSRQIHDMYWMPRMPSGLLTAGFALAGGLPERAVPTANKRFLKIHFSLDLRTGPYCGSPELGLLQRIAPTYCSCIVMIIKRVLG